MMGLRGAVVVAACVAAAVAPVETQGAWVDSAQVVVPATGASSTSNNLYMQLNGDEVKMYLEPPSGDQIYTAHIMFNVDKDSTTGYSGNTNTGYADGLDGYFHIEFDWNSPTNLIEPCFYTGRPDKAGQQKFCVGAGNFAKVDASLGAELTTSKSAIEAATGMSIGDSVGMMTVVYNRGWNLDVNPEGFLSYAEVSMASDSAPVASPTPPPTNPPVAPVASPTPPPVEPRPCGNEERAAVVWSDESQQKFFDLKSFAASVMAAQQQLMQYGLPYDVVSLDDLLDVDTACRYSVVVLVAATHVNAARAEDYVSALEELNTVHGVAMIVLGGLIQYDADGTMLDLGMSAALQRVAGVRFADLSWGTAASSEIVPTVAGVSPTGMFAERTAGETLFDMSSGAIEYFNSFEPLDDAGEVMAVQRVDRVQSPDAGIQEFSAIVATPASGSRGARVHFANTGLGINRDLVWRAVRYARLSADAGSGAQAPVSVGLRLTRFSGTFATRNDMDLSKYNNVALNVERNQLETSLRPWYEQYGYVATHYINVGETDTEFTNWEEMRPLYDQYVELESEIASHSYTHPYQMSDLSSAELYKEFKLPTVVIAGNMSQPRCGTAQPGNPEDWPTLVELVDMFEPSAEYGNYPTHYSGGYMGYPLGTVGTGAGFLPGRKDTFVSFVNMAFDFTLIQWQKISPDAAKAHWDGEIDFYYEFANMPMLFYPIHDYATTAYNPDTSEVGTSTEYPFGMLESPIANVAGRNIEFVTHMDLSDRVRSFTHSVVTVERTGDNELQVDVTPPAAHATDPYGGLGHFVLDLHQADLAGIQVGAVEGHPAFDGSRVLVPRNGGSFKITLSTSGPLDTARARLVSMGMRTSLESLMLNGETLSVVVKGRGNVVFHVPAVAISNGFGIVGARCGFTRSGTVLTVPLCDGAPFKLSVGPSWIVPLSTVVA